MTDWTYREIAEDPSRSSARGLDHPDLWDLQTAVLLALSRLRNPGTCEYVYGKMPHVPGLKLKIMMFISSLTDDVDLTGGHPPIGPRPEEYDVGAEKIRLAAFWAAECIRLDAAV